MCAEIRWDQGRMTCSGKHAFSREVAYGLFADRKQFAFTEVEQREIGQLGRRLMTSWKPTPRAPAKTKD